MPLYIRIAIRYLFSLKSKILSFMTVISIVGITVGVAALLITLAVMSGFLWGIKEKLLETTPQVVIFKITGKFNEYKDFGDYIFSDIPEIVDWEPFVYSQALASKGKTVQAITIRGVNPDKDKNIMGLDKKIIVGKYDLSDENKVIIGKDLAFALDVSVGDTINIMSPFGRKTPLGFLPKIKKVKVAGILYFGVFEYDSSFVGMNLKAAQKFFDLGDSVTGIQIKIKDPYQADLVKKKIQKKLSYPYVVRTWMDMNKSLFQALELEKFAMFLVLALIVLVASFNVSSLLITKAREKRKDIAILKTIGADNTFIQKVFLWQGLIIGIIGTSLGLIIGLSAIYIADTYHLVKLNPEVYMINYLPLKISALDILSVAIASMIICFISSIIPARMSSKEVPAEVLRYE